MSRMDRTTTSPTFPQMAMLLALAWGLTNIAYAIYDLPLKFVLKDELHLNAQDISGFFALGVHEWLSSRTGGAGGRHWNARPWTIRPRCRALYPQITSAYVVAVAVATKLHENLQEALQTALEKQLAMASSLSFDRTS